MMAMRHLQRLHQCRHAGTIHVGDMGEIDKQIKLFLIYQIDYLVSYLWRSIEIDISRYLQNGTI